MLTGEALGGANSASGTFSGSGIPVGATIENAFLYTNSWFTFPNISGSIGALNFGPSAAAGISGGGDLAGYRWDVTSAVTGNGSYGFSLSNRSEI